MSLIFSSLCLSCMLEEDTPYTLTIDGYKANFYGYYYVDGELVRSFEGIEDFTDSAGNTHYYYDRDLEEFDSIKVYAFKSNEKCTLTASIWSANLEVATETSGEYEYESYDEDTDTYTYKIALDPLYYESDDDSTDGDE